METGSAYKGAFGLYGGGLASFSACQRLRDVSLQGCSNLDGRQLKMQLPHPSNLVGLHILRCPGVNLRHEYGLKDRFRTLNRHTLQVMREQCDF
jgi:hypothetical protein